MRTNCFAYAPFSLLVRMLLPMLAEWLCEQQGKDPRATRMVEGVHLFLVLTMNPDGFALQRRENG